MLLTATQARQFGTALLEAADKVNQDAQQQMVICSVDTFTAITPKKYFPYDPECDTLIF